MTADQEEACRQRIMESRLACQSFLQLYIDMLKKFEKPSVSPTKSDGIHSGLADDTSPKVVTNQVDNSEVA